MTTGATLKATLSTINGENIPDTLWELLPDSVAGEQWRGEIWDAARTLADWLHDDRDYSLDQLQDMTHQLADSEVEDYYSNINRRVQELALWANSDLDEEVEQLNHGTGFLTMTSLNTQYLFCAMRGLYSVLVEWATDTAEDMEEVA